jgi:hypothetical protein
VEKSLLEGFRGGCVMATRVICRLLGVRGDNVMEVEVSRSGGLNANPSI